MLTSIATSQVPENHTLESQTSLEATATDVYNKKKQKPRNSNKTTEAAGKMTTRKSSSLISNNNPDILHTTEIQLLPTNDKIITNTEQQQEEVKEVNEKENINQEDTCTKDNFVMNTNETDKPSTTLDIHSSTNQIMDADNILPSPISQKSESVNLTETNISKDEDHVMTDKDSEKFHQEALQALTRIEVQFAKLRQKVFEEKMKELQNELIMIENGTHPDQIAMMQEIDNKRECKIKRAKAKREIQLLSHKKKYEASVHQANVTFKFEKNSLRSKLNDRLNMKRCRIKDEHLKITSPKKSHMSIPLKLRYQSSNSKELDYINKHIGFPRATSTNGLSNQDINDDLLEIKAQLSKNDHHYLHYTAPSMTSSSSSSTSSFLPSTPITPSVSNSSLPHPFTSSPEEDLMYSIGDIHMSK